MLREQLQQVLEPVVTGLGYELWALEYGPRPGGSVLRVYIDRHLDAGHVLPQGQSAITVEDCARASRAVSEALETLDPIPGNYTLEVSSPGLDRVLCKPEHFERYTGENVKLEMKELVAGKRRFSGRLIRTDAGAITVDIGGSSVQLAIEGIHKARLAPEY